MQRRLDLHLSKGKYNQMRFNPFTDDIEKKESYSGQISGWKKKMTTTQKSNIDNSLFIMPVISYSALSLSYKSFVGYVNNL